MEEIYASKNVVLFQGKKGHNLKKVIPFMVKAGTTLGDQFSTW